MAMNGWYVIGGNVVRDLAALNNVEMLPWDCWGPMPPPGTPVTEDYLEVIDRLAALTQVPDASFEHLRAAYEREDLRVPPSVYNAVRDAVEVV